MNQHKDFITQLILYRMFAKLFITFEKVTFAQTIFLVALSYLTDFLSFYVDFQLTVYTIIGSEDILG